MSGVGAFLDLRGGLPVGDRLLDILSQLSPFGPDAARVHTSGPAALGCTRMYVRDGGLDVAPMVARHEQTAVVADARLDNRESLAQQLGVARSDLAALSDCELILRAYLRWSEDCPRHLLGDFAFVVWDGARQRLFCARDHVGKRVLYYYGSPAFFAVASSLRGLLCLPEIDVRLNEEKIAEFLVLMQSADTTFYDGVKRLPPAHALVVARDEFRLKEFWALDPDRRIELRSDDEYVEAFLEVFREAVRARLRGAGEAAVMVSGGLDSPAVTAVAATELRSEGRSLRAFHAAPPAGFDGQAHRGWIVDESEDVAAVTALHPNIDLQIIRPDDRTLLDGLDGFFEMVGTPLRNPINRPWFDMIYERAEACGVQVMLTGQRGNATFSYHGLPGLREYVTSGRWLTLRRELRALGAARGQSPAALLRYKVLQPMLPWLPPVIRRLRGNPAPQRKLPRDQMAAPIHPAFADEFRVDDRIRAAGFDNRSIRTADGRTMRIRLLTGSADGPDVLQGYRTRYGVVPLDPTADIRVIEYCLAIPEAQYLRGGQDRYLARRAMTGLLPDRVRLRTTRGTQAADWPRQMDVIRAQLADELEHLRRTPLAARCLDLDRMTDLVKRWPERLGLEHHYDYGLLLLRGVVMGRFIRWVENHDWRAMHRRQQRAKAIAT